MARFNTEGLREEIRHALMTQPRTRGQLDGFEAVGYDAIYALKPKHEECNGVMVESEVVRTMACKSFKDPSLPVPFDAFRSARIAKAVKAAPEPCADWMLYCYGEGARLPTADLLQELIHQFMRSEPKAMRKDSKELVKHLALLACQQKRDQIEGRKDVLPQTHIAKLAGKGQKAWEKFWAPRWNRLLQVLDNFDIEGLNHVYESGRRSKTAGRNPRLSLPFRVSAATGAKVVACLAT